MEVRRRDINIVKTFTSLDYTNIVTLGLSLEATRQAVLRALRDNASLKMVARKQAASFVGREVAFYVYNASSDQVWTQIAPERVLPQKPRTHHPGGHRLVARPSNAIIDGGTPRLLH